MNLWHSTSSMGRMSEKGFNVAFKVSGMVKCAKERRF